MGLQEVTARVKTLNAKATQLNATRNQKVGAKAQAQRTYNEKVAAYKKAYGIDITDQNIQSEYSAVLKKATEECDSLEKSIADIENGTYLKKEEPKVKQPVATEVPLNAIAEKHIDLDSGVYTGAPENTTSPAFMAVNSQTSAPAESVVTAPAQTVSVPAPAVVSANDLAKQMDGTVGNAQYADAEDDSDFDDSEDEDSEESFQPAGWGQQAPANDGKIDEAFGDILGSKFQL